MATTLLDFLDEVLQRTDRTGLKVLRGVALFTRNARAELVADFKEDVPAHEELPVASADALAEKITELVNGQPAKTRLELRATFDTAPTERFPLGDWSFDESAVPPAAPIAMAELVDKPLPQTVPPPPAPPPGPAPAPPVEVQEKT